jgi:diguanylate cyclase (GGDEF)-like protein
MIKNNEELADILIVDDDSSVIITLNKVLNNIGRIRFASNAKQALIMVKESLPDLILLDVELPDIRGLEVCELLKKSATTEHIPILFITSHTEVGFEEKVFLAGGADYIGKPLNPSVVAARVQTHIDYHRAIKRLENLAHTDGLTGLANRRRFDNQLCIELKRSRREMLPLTVVLIDIDEFKKYNDHFGHIEGDECIKAIATVLMDAVRRPADIAARYGGDELALILPDTDAQGAYELLINLQASIAKLSIKHAPEAKYDKVTISMGYSTLIPKQIVSNEADDFVIVKAADYALYEAKVNGRNQISHKKSS